MSNVSFPVFYIPFGECSIANFDFTELKKDTRWVKGASQNMYGNDYTEDRYKILDSYPELKRLILSNFFILYDTLLNLDKPIFTSPDT